MRKATALSAGCGLLFVILAAGCGGGSDGPALTLTQVEPSVGANEGGTLVTLTGSGFGRLLDEVTFGREEATDLRYINDTTITCVTPRGTTGLCDIRVTTAQNSVVMEECFTYLPPVPVIVGVTPNEGPPSVATRITVTGSHFLHGTVAVTLDGRTCGSVDVTSDASLTCTVPSLPSGQNLTLEVTTDGGTTSLADAYSYLVYPYNGTYFFVEFDGLTISNTPAAQARWGTLITEGGGVYTGGEIWTNDQGAVSGPTTPPTTKHYITEDRLFTVGSHSNPSLVGRITADGSLGILGSVKVGVSPTLMIVGRVEGGPYDEASLSGIYHAGAVFGDGATRGAIWGTTEFDGTGGADSVSDYNVEGSLFGLPPGSDTYTVSTDGRVTYGLTDSDLSLEGQILQGGDLVILAGGAVTPEFPVVVVLVRATSGADLSTFSGNYAFAAMLKGNPGWDANTGTAQSYGDGNATVLDLLGHDGDVTWDDWPESPFALPYTVSSDGILEAYVDGSAVGGGGMDTQGAVMDGGEFAFFSGSRAPGERPMLWFLLR